MGKRKGQDRKKVAVVFDENKRKDFLCGFRKRKLERKKKAQDELQRMLKEEKKRIKLENKESYKKLVVSSRPIPDIEQLLKDEYEDEDVNVKIVELSSDTLQKRNLCIGDNRPKEVEVKKVEKVKKDQAPEILGMGSDTECEAEESGSEKEDDQELKTKKDIKRMLKKQATKKIQKSKPFQIKNKMERIKNRKKSHHKKGNVESKGHKKGSVEGKGHNNKNHKEKSKKNFGRRKHGK